MQNHAIEIEKHPLKGILICLLSYFFISFTSMCGKMLSSTISVQMILFAQNIICLLLIVPELLKNKINLLKLQHPGTYFVRIVSGLGCYAALFYILRFVPVSEALIYQYSASLWIPFIMFFWWKVRMPKKMWLGILVGFIGIVLILKPSMSSMGMISMVGILCAILQGISVVAIRKLSISEPTLRILFYYFLVGTITTCPFVVMYGSPISVRDLLGLLGIGFSTYVAQKLFTTACRYANATTLAPICYTSILFTGIFGWIFWDEIPESVTLLGMFLVVFGCILSILMSKTSAKLQEAAE